MLRFSDRYASRGTETLRNRFGIRDPAELARREHDAVTARLLELRARPLPGRYNFPHLQTFHRRIFGDVYPWAGEIWTVPIAKGDLFALPEHIEPYLTGVLAAIPAESYLRALDRNQMIERLTHYLAEINAAHPFREGNGRTQRAFVGQLASEAGYLIAWERIDAERNNDASVASTRGDDTPLCRMLDEIVVAHGG